MTDTADADHALATIEALSTRLLAMSPRFHLTPGLVEGGHRLADLDDADTMTSVLAEYATQRGTDDGQVAASLLVQTLATRTTAIALAAALEERVLVLPAPSDISFRLQGLSGSIGFTGATVLGIEGVALYDWLPWWTKHWSETVFAPLINSVRRVQRVGRRMLEGNVASAVAGNLVFLDWWSPDANYGTLRDALLAGGSPTFSTMASVIDMTYEDRTGIASERSSCCLQLRLGTGHECPTCPMVSAEDRWAMHAKHLGHLAAFRANGGMPAHR